MKEAFIHGCVHCSSVCAAGNSIQPCLSTSARLPFSGAFGHTCNRFPSESRSPTARLPKRLASPAHAAPWPALAPPIQSRSQSHAIAWFARTAAWAATAGASSARRRCWKWNGKVSKRRVSPGLTWPWLPLTLGMSDRRGRLSAALEPKTRRRERTTMQVNLPHDLEILVNKRLSSGGYASVEDVFRRALEAQDAEESWTDEERKALTAHVEEGFLQAERGELIDGAQVRREIQGMKDNWRQARTPRR